MKVLHYKSNFLNASETFIERVIRNHKKFTPVGMCIHKREFTKNLTVHSKPQFGWPYVWNTICFHLNWCLPFYNKTLKIVEPDIIHAHFGFDGYRMIKPALTNQIPLVVSFYGSDVSRLPNEFDWMRRYRKLAKAGSAFIAATGHMKDRLANLGFPSDKIYVVPFGLDLNKFKRKDYAEKPSRMMMVGRMVEKKGFIYALEAIKILKCKGQLCYLDLYGDGLLKKKLEKKTIEFGISHLVNFYGHVPIERIIKEHKRHNILLAPSLTAKDGDEEGLPNTILEAMASGTIVITTNHAAIGEVIQDGENGFIIQEGNASALANAILQAKELDWSASAICKNARKTIEDQFQINDVVSKLETLYKELIKRYD